MMQDKQRIKKAINYLENLWLEYRTKDLYTSKYKLYSRWQEKYNKYKVKNALTLLKNSETVKHG